MEKQDFHVYNKRGVLLTKVYDEDGNVTRLTYDQFGRLLYHVFGVNRTPVFNNKGKLLIGIYNDKGRPKSTTYNREGEVIMPILDEFERPNEFLFDKDGIPLYDAKGKHWVNVFEDLDVEGKRKRRRPMRKGKGRPVTQKEVKELTKQIEQLRQQLLELIKDNAKTFDDGSEIDKLREDSNEPLEGYLSSVVYEKINHYLFENHELDKSSKVDPGKRISTAERSQLSMSKVKIDEKEETFKLGTIPDVELIKKDVETKLKDSEIKEKRVCFNVDCGGSQVEEVCKEDSKCEIFKDDEETCGASGLLGETDEALEDLEYAVKNVHFMSQRKEAFFKHLANALVLVTRSLNNLFCNSKLILNENEDMAVELEDQYDEIETIKKRGTMPWKTQEKHFNDIHVQLDYMYSYQQALKSKKCDLKLALHHMNHFKEQINSREDQIEQSITKKFTKKNKLNKHIFELKKELARISAEQEVMAEDVQKKADKEEFETFKDCVFHCLTSVQDYINNFMKKPLIVTDLKERQYFQCECSDTGVVRMGINVKQPTFPGLDLFKSKAFEGFV